MNDSVMGHSDQWLPINPGTDAALVAGIAHWLIKNDKVDTEFLHKYCVGFDEETMPEAYQGKSMSYSAYVLGSARDCRNEASVRSARLGSAASQQWRVDGMGDHGAAVLGRPDRHCRYEQRYS